MPEHSIDNFKFVDWKCHIVPRHWAGNAIVVISQHDMIAHKIKYMAKSGEIKEINETESVPEEDVIVVPQEMLQAICNELARNGIKPNNRRYKEEAELKDAHLDDMRNIVFKLLHMNAKDGNESN